MYLFHVFLLVVGELCKCYLFQKDTKYISCQASVKLVVTQFFAWGFSDFLGQGSLNLHPC